MGCCQMAPGQYLNQLWHLIMRACSIHLRAIQTKNTWNIIHWNVLETYTLKQILPLFSGGVWPIYIKQHGRISKITILLKRHFSLCTRMLCSSYQSKINTVNTKTRITRITTIWNVYKLTIMTSPPFKGKFIKHAMWTNFNSGICLQSPMVNPCVLKSGESMVNFSIEHHLKFSLN